MRIRLISNLSQLEGAAFEYIAMGESAGISAAQSIEESCALQDINRSKLTKSLLKYGQILEWNGKWHRKWRYNIFGKPSNDIVLPIGPQVEELLPDFKAIRQKKSLMVYGFWDEGRIDAVLDALPLGGLSLDMRVMEPDAIRKRYNVGCI